MAKILEQIYLNDKGLHEFVTLSLFISLFLSLFLMQWQNLQNFLLPFFHHICLTFKDISKKIIPILILNHFPHSSFFYLNDILAKIVWNLNQALFLACFLFFSQILLSICTLKNLQPSQYSKLNLLGWLSILCYVYFWREGIELKNLNKFFHIHN